MESRAYTVMYLSVIFFLIFTLLVALIPQANEINADRLALMEQGESIFERWRHEPLTQRRKFYFYNVSNEEEWTSSGSDLKMEEIGPFIYDVRTSGTTDEGMSIDDLKFVSENSTGGEDTTVHLPSRGGLVEDMGAQHDQPGVLIRRSVRKLVRDILSNGGGWIASTPLREISSNSSFPDPSEANLCSEKYLVSPLLNETFFNDPSTLKVYQALPCSSVALKNASDIENRTHPVPFNMVVSQLTLNWQDLANASKVKNALFLNVKSSPPPSDTRFVISSFTAQLNIEPYSSVVTNIALQYAMSFSFVFDNNGSLSSVTYPFMRAEISCRSARLTDEFLYRYIVFPLIFKEQVLPRTLFFGLLFLLVTVMLVYLLVHCNRSSPEDAEKIPLLTLRRKILLESLMT